MSPPLPADVNSRDDDDRFQKADEHRQKNARALGLDSVEHECELNRRKDVPHEDCDTTEVGGGQCHQHLRQYRNRVRINDGVHHQFEPTSFYQPFETTVESFHHVLHDFLQILWVEIRI